MLAHDPVAPMAVTKSSVVVACIEDETVRPR